MKGKISIKSDVSVHLSIVGSKTEGGRKDMKLNNSSSNNTY